MVQGTRESGRLSLRDCCLSKVVNGCTVWSINEQKTMRENNK